MLQSNRALLDLGIPELDDRAFIRHGKQIRTYISTGSSGSSTPTNQTITQTNIPAWAKPYAENMLGQAQVLTDVNANPFQPYTQQRFAGFSPMQTQAFDRAANQQVSPQLADASNMAYSAGMQGLGAQQNAQDLQNTALGYGQAGSMYGSAASNLGLSGAAQARMNAQNAQNRAMMFGNQASNFGAQGAMGAQQAQQVAENQADQYGQMGAGYGAAGASLAPQAQMYGAGAAQMGQQGMQYGAQGAGIGGIGVQKAQQGFNAGNAYRQEATSPGAMSQYMSPYMENVVDRQQQEAIRNSEIMRNKIQAGGVSKGAFGGSRSAILEAERQRNLGDRLADIEASGLQQAFQDARQAQQFGSSLGIQGLEAGYQGLRTGMEGTAQGMRGAQVGMAGQQAGMAGVGQAGDLYGLGMQGARLGLEGTGQRLNAGRLGLEGARTGIAGSQAGLAGVGQELNAGQLDLRGVDTGIKGQAAGMKGSEVGLAGVGRATSAGQYGLAGGQLAGQSAGTLGQLGEAQYRQEMGITDAMQKYGAVQQAHNQQGLDFAYDQEMARQRYPYEQLSYFSDRLRGVPANDTVRSAYEKGPDPYAQALGTAATIYGATAKEGGHVKRLAQGGVTAAGAESMNSSELEQKLKRLSDGQLQAYAKAVKDPATQSVIRKEIQRRQGVRIPQMGAQTQASAPAMAQQTSIGKARGGIVALSGGGDLAFGPKITFPRRADLGIEEEKPLGVGSLTNPEIAMQRPSLLSGRPDQEKTEEPVVPQPPVEEPNIPKPPAPQATGIMAAGKTPFEQFRAQIPKAEIDPARQAILDDMQARLDQQLARADEMEGREVKDAIMAAGLAMMSGRSLAEGVALAAQAGGQQYFESREDTEAAMLEAENAELAFRQYELDLLEGNEDKAREEFGMFLDHTANMANARARAAKALGASGLESVDPLDYTRVINLVKEDPDLIAIENEIASVEALGVRADPADLERLNLERDRIYRNAVKRAFTRFGLTDIYNQGKAQTDGEMPKLGSSSSAPLPLSRGMKPQDMVGGKWYSTVDGPMVWDPEAQDFFLPQGS